MSAVKKPSVAAVLQDLATLIDSLPPKHYDGPGWEAGLEAGKGRSAWVERRATMAEIGNLLERAIERAVEDALAEAPRKHAEEYDALLDAATRILWSASARPDPADAKVVHEAWVTRERRRFESSRRAKPSSETPGRAE